MQPVPVPSSKGSRAVKTPSEASESYSEFEDSQQYTIPHDGDETPSKASKIKPDSPSNESLVTVMSVQSSKRDFILRQDTWNAK